MVTETNATSREQTGEIRSTNAPERGREAPARYRSTSFDRSQPGAVSRVGDRGVSRTGIVQFESPGRTGHGGR